MQTGTSDSNSAFYVSFDCMVFKSQMLIRELDKEFEKPNKRWYTHIVIRRSLFDIFGGYFDGRKTVQNKLQTFMEVIN